MASRVPAATGGKSEIGKGSGVGDEKQRKLKWDRDGNKEVDKDRDKVKRDEAGVEGGEKKTKKEVSFRLEKVDEVRCEWERFREEKEKEWVEMKNRWKGDKKEELDLAEEWKRKERSLDIRMRVIEERLVEVERNLMNVIDALEARKGEEEERRRVYEETERGGTEERGRSNRGVEVVETEVRGDGSIVSEDRFSWKRSEENWQNRVQELLWEKLKVQCRVGYIRKSGQVLIVKIESEEEKQDILANKNRLKGDRIFVEHDLTWEERKRQEEIKKWAIEQRNV
ncbi:golgin subfamily A member 6-like protein 6 [Ooceraea biroi]|uniref:golgin subfamily A member 6-like protein 6 n=1 Tax=Ooceraea biroi TaxID=2015173 RepID=UPI0009716408|nr:golgin subfamily A member 6-like protein 6 [Ooceraea biroi]